MSPSALVVIDVQRGAFSGDWPMPDGDALVAACRRAVAHARAAGWTLLWVQHHEPGGPMDGTGFAIDPRLDPAPGEARIVKTEPDAFSNAALGALLGGCSRVLLAGLQSDCCVRATALGGRQRALPVEVIADAHHTWASEGRSALAIRDAVNAELAAAGIPTPRLDTLDPHAAPAPSA
jgi:nicotinamidase-related amidase